jgi:hypothetical protein
MRIEFDVPEAILGNLLGEVRLPRMALVHYDMATPTALPDLGSSLRGELAKPNVQDSIKSGSKVAIGVGSRGISDLPTVVSILVDHIRGCGADPFIVPSMGSHGGATAAGQIEVLAHLGVTETQVGAPIRSSMDVVTLGQTADGAPVYFDRLASEADAIVFVARVKPHTAFRGAYESGLAKMVAIGLGKQAGAAATHALGFGAMAQKVPEMAAVALHRAPIAFGVAVLENAHDRPFKIQVVPASQIFAVEPALLQEARSAMPRIPFDDFDVLVIDRIGKNISGDGADPNITGRYPTIHASGGPSVTKQVVLDLASGSAGNANGIGTADFTTVRAARKIDLGQTYPNALTSTVARPVALPMVLPSDRMAIAAAVLTCHAVRRDPRIVRIVDTLQLERFWISEGLLRESAENSALKVVAGVSDFSFDAHGDLEDLASLPVALSVPV